MNKAMVGNIKEGRMNLGEEMPVEVYRLFEFTLKDVLQERYGKEQCAELFREAGKRAGIQFCLQYLDCTLSINNFMSALQNTLREMKIGILRIEAMDMMNSELTVTISEDLDCSGLPITGETVCNYDEGFIAGILKQYTKEDYHVREIDCWAKGDRVCRFQAKRIGGGDAR